MKKILIACLSSLLFASAQDGDRFYVSDYLYQAQKGIQQAYREGAAEKNPYSYEKARAYFNIAQMFTYNMDFVGGQVFSLRSLNESMKMVEDIKSNEKKIEKPESPQLEEPYTKLVYLKENKADRCAPRDLAWAEAYYEGLVYELKKEDYNKTLVDLMMDSLKRYITTAQDKVEKAAKENLYCYTQRLEPVAEKTPEVKQEEAKIQVEKRRVIEEPIKVVARVHFDFNKATIKKEYIPVLDEVVKFLKENPNVKVRIEGFTDDIGSKKYNNELALKRAKTVADYLISNGISRDRIQTVGYGKERYIAPNNSSIGRLTNRRVEFITIKVEE